MIKLTLAILVACSIILLYSASASSGLANRLYMIKNTISKDYGNFYSTGNSGQLMAGIAFAGLLANTNVDMDIQKVYQTSFKNKNTDNLAKVTKPFGNGMETLPAYLGIALIGEVIKNSHFDFTAGEWSRRSLRSITVGAPSLLFLQRALGASRPKETHSHWQPFNDDNGVSGHSFMGAVPFLTAAHMCNNSLLRCSLYIGSTLTGISRINDNNHYFSQAALGWWMAYLASAGNEGIGNEEVVIAPGVIQESVGLFMIFHF
ncbi:MAG: phosphatase PAP2 family protein [bacterium]